MTINNLEYEYIKRTANDIMEGKRFISRLSASEEKGRIAGGRRAIEASIILGISEATDRTQFSPDQMNRKQENLLEEYAKHEAIWVDFESEIDGKWEGVNGVGGQEARIYRSKEHYLKKVIDYHQYSDSMMEFLDNRIALHNAMFPDTSYELTGFTRVGKFFSPIVEQRFIKGNGYNAASQFAEYMANIGFEQFSYSDTSFYNDSYLVEDLHEQNVLEHSSHFFFIDTLPSLRNKKGYKDFKIVDDLNEINE